MVQGRDLAKMSSEELARYRRNDVGMVFQAFHLIPAMTITENVELPMRFAEVERAERAQRVRESLERVGLGKRLEHRPSELSGGEQQTRLAGAGAGQSSVAPAGRRAHRQSRQPHRRGHPQPDSRRQPVAGHDGGDGDARARAGRTLCAAPDLSGRRQAAVSEEVLA